VIGAELRQNACRRPLTHIKPDPCFIKGPSRAFVFIQTKSVVVQPALSAYGGKIANA